MNKPYSVLVKEFNENVAELINNSGLHISIIKNELGKLYRDVERISEQVTKQEIEDYENSLKKDTEKDTEKENTANNDTDNTNNKE